MLGTKILALYAIIVLLWDRGMWWNGSARCRGKCDGYSVDISISRVKIAENAKEMKS